MIGLVLFFRMGGAGTFRESPGKGIVLLVLTVLVSFLYGAVIGAFTSITFAWRPAFGLGLSIAYLLWIVFLIGDLFRTGIDDEALKERFYPAPDDRHHEGDPRVAAEADAARERVLAARAELATEVERLQASARAAVDIPAKVRRTRHKAAAVVGGVGFVALGGPRRLFRRAKSAIVGPDQPLPESMLPEEVEKTLKRLGTDGERVRGTLERDFADYLKVAQKRRGPALRQTLYYAVTLPLIRRGGRLAVDWLLQPDQRHLQAQIEALRSRLRARGDQLADEPDPSVLAADTEGGPG